MLWIKQKKKILHKLLFDSKTKEQEADEKF